MKILNCARKASYVVTGIAACIIGFSTVSSPAYAQRDRGDRDRRDDQRDDKRDDKKNDKKDTKRDTRSGRDSSDWRKGSDITKRTERDTRHNETQSKFTRSIEGRRFDNGITLRRALPHTDRHLDVFFPSHSSYYPHYIPTRSAGIDVVISPFHFYYGIFPSYIPRSRVFRSAPSRIFIDLPIYVGNEYRGYRDDIYDRDNDRWRDDRDFRQSVNDLEDAYVHEDVMLLTSLTDPRTRIAIFNRGRYEYSLDANDYLDMTRDFMQTSRSKSFDVYRVHYRSSSVYQIFAKHTYRDSRGDNRVVYMVLVMERIGGRWTLTQVDSSPDRYQD